MLIGRTEERKKLQSLYQSSKSEFVILYGRRRVGKTYLVREVFKNKFDFNHVGLANATLKEQLLNFNLSLVKFGKKEETIPENWLSAFEELAKLIERKKSKKKVLFIDELPWLDTPKSGFLSAFEHFWNAWASARKDILLIACGSAASWMIKKIINNKGGLHNRISAKIKLHPFSLKECKNYFQRKQFAFNEYQILQLYMVLGGVPFYLDGLDKGLSASQNIDELCFAENGLLKNEFTNLYASLFNNYENHIAIIEALSKKNKGLKREELIKSSGLSNGGGTTTILNELEESGFIQRYFPFSNKIKDALYQLVDPFSLFYFRFIKPNPKTTKGFWELTIDSPKYRSWSGLAFEQLCFSHINQIKSALGISGIQSTVSSWVNDQAQVDLVIDRNDQVVNLFEMKFPIHEYEISKKYADELRNKIAEFKKGTKTKKAVYLSFLTTYGLKENKHSRGLVQNSFDRKVLFL